MEKYKIDPPEPYEHFQEFLTEEQEERLRDFYFDKDNEVEEKLTEQGFRDWIEDLDWSEIYSYIGDPREQYFDKE